MSPPLPATYRAAVITEPGAPFTVVERPLRAPAGDEVLIKVLASGICYSDRAATAGSPLSSYPRVPGHEVVGRVAAHGGPGLLAGALVGAGWIGASCGACDACLANEPFACAGGVAHGAGTDGGHAEYMYARPQGLVRLPEEALGTMSYAEVAPLLCAGVSAYEALLACRDFWSPGDIIGVHGIGGIGHLAIQYAAKMGLQVHAITSSGKSDLARSLGATGVVDASSDIAAYFVALGGAHLILSTVPTPGAFSSTLAQCLKRGGTLMFVGIPYGGDGGDALDVPTTLMVVKRLSVRGWVPGCAREYEDAVRFSVQAGIKPLVKTYSLDDIQSAFDELLTERPAHRNVIIFPN